MKITAVLKAAGWKVGLLSIFAGGVGLGVLPVEEVRTLGAEAGSGPTGEMMVWLRRKGLRGMSSTCSRLESERLPEDAVIAREFARSRAEQRETTFVSGRKRAGRLRGVDEALSANGDDASNARQVALQARFGRDL